MGGWRLLSLCTYALLLLIRPQKTLDSPLLLEKEKQRWS